MKYLYFLPYSLAATTTWALATATIGYVFGEYWNELLAVARNVGYGFVALVVLFIALYLYRRRRAKNKRTSEDRNL
jgi:membrane protein DedA with SNARE-associated domain